MKDFGQIWNRLAGRTYNAVSTNNNAINNTSSDESTDKFGAERRAHKPRITRSLIWLAFLSFIAFSSGLFVLLAHPYDILFKLKCVFADGGEIFEMWRRPPVDLYLRVFIFNVTNRDAFLAGEEKLRVEEIGPYVYKELMSHENITFNENATLTAAPSHPLVWVPELSDGNQEDDQFILPNIALLSITDVVKDASYFTRFGLNMLVRQTNSQPLIQMSAKEFMFGYKSSLLTLGNNFMPGWIKFDKLGLIDRMYDFDGDYETVYTGEDDVTKAGLIDTYRGSVDLPQWEGKHCSLVQGSSDGTKFPSYIKPNQQLKFFRKSMCRSAILVRVNSTQRDELDAYWYKFAPNSLDNGQFDPDNKCFCHNEDCLPSGLLDVHGCYYGFPIALSYPHFLYSDPRLLNGVEGSKPDPSKHESYFVIQPESGLPLDVAVRMQINMHIGDVSNMARVEKFSNMTLPMLWTESRMYSLPEILAMRFKLYLNVLPSVETGAMYLLFVTGFAFLALTARKFYKMRAKWTSQNRIGTEWIDDDVTIQKSNFFRVQRRDTMSSKELEVYFNSLMTPLNQDLSFQEFTDLKEEIV